VFGIQLPIDITTGHMIKPNLDVYYPMIIKLLNTTVQQKINAAILSAVNKMITDQGYSINPNTQISASYEIKTNERGILSLTLINDAYSGGAHSLTIITPLSFDVNTGSLYTLKDLFKPGSNYVKVLSAIVDKQIKARNIYLLGEFIGIKQNQEFYISDKALVLVFQLYELTSYAFGFPHFPISVYDIKDIINQQGPLGKMLYL
jgi:hypothetical protein